MAFATLFCALLSLLECAVVTMNVPSTQGGRPSGKVYFDVLLYTVLKVFVFLGLDRCKSTAVRNSLAVFITCLPTSCLTVGQASFSVDMTLLSMIKARAISYSLSLLQPTYMLDVTLLWVSILAVVTVWLTLVRLQRCRKVRRQTFAVLSCCRATSSRTMGFEASICINHHLFGRCCCH